MIPRPSKSKHMRRAATAPETKHFALSGLRCGKMLPVMSLKGQKRKSSAAPAMSDLPSKADIRFTHLAGAITVVTRPPLWPETNEAAGSMNSESAAWSSQALPYKALMLTADCASSNGIAI